MCGICGVYRKNCKNEELKRAIQKNIDLLSIESTTESRKIKEIHHRIISKENKKFFRPK